MSNKFIKAAHSAYYGHRCDIRPGIKYFTYKDYKNLYADPFSFINKNGFKLRGYIYHEKDYIKDKLVIFCHGMGGGHQAYMNEIAFLCKHKYQVLSFDYQGCVLSDGDKINCFLQNASDVDDCINFINTKDEYKNLTKYIIGHSWGGFSAQSALKYHNDIKKLVMISGLISIDNAYKENTPWYGKLFVNSILRYERSLYPNYYDNNAIDNLNNRDDVKALIIHSKDDSIVSYKNNALKLMKYVTNKNVTYCIVDNKNHNPQYSKQAVINLTNYMHKLESLNSDELKNKEAANTDFHILCELDETIMLQIVDFLNQ